ncbi:hypothetical protein P153DRAFT_434311 [Dothidotthia symphoricarpi CBS 119687]|uniref:Heterokaryon incompatibility domain-containing protein n=1 Tax=Dothidotthia symphoricarpi CBS 119687 TaxID=1392245 RepID=A0A6A6A232_9PLEO|nr:uncharacterized protein P153DRAFT_434311 [Dothidotthia symphoricarpi CBS 119687]KAF2125909.1 hypothetical protein P153DRAFT_434311 [Dothidotthia symphoricarpi CBS 119687]
MIIDKRCLSIRAKKLDDVVQICEEKEDLRHGLHSSTIWQMIAALDVTYTMGESREEVVWRSLITNRGNVSPPESAQYPACSDLLKPSFHAWILWRYAVAFNEPTTFPISSSANDILPSQAEIDKGRNRSKVDPVYLAFLAHQASLFNLSYSHAMRQRPFRTRQGYFGIGSKCLDVGDSVWIVPGCRVPIILRPIKGSGRYCLVGGTYVHGVMNGEALLSCTDLDFEMVGLE